MAEPSETFQDKMSFFHSLQTIPTEANQEVYEALYKAGHTVRTTEIWADSIDYCADAAACDTWVSGNPTIGNKYTTTALTEVAGSNGEAWYINDSGFIQDWINPRDVPHATTKVPSYGFQAILYKTDGSTIITPSEGVWGVDYKLGIVWFQTGSTPSDLSYGTPKITCYNYIGDTADAIIADDKVKVDSGATADYIGAASNDGVLRVGSPLSYADGGNYITLDITANGINDTHIDWGTGANQVSALDVPITDSGSYYTGAEVETALQEIGGKFEDIDHGSLGGLADDDHTQYILHSLADAANDFLVASGADIYVKKTLAETGAILETDIDHGNIQGLGDGSDHSFIDQSVISGATPTFTGTNITAVASITVADESADTTCFPLFAIAATGTIAGKTGTNLTFNSSTGVLTATTISGANVTTGADPGHTHTGASLSSIDISDDTNLAVTAPIVLTDDTVSFDSTLLGTTTWGAGAAITWTFDASAGTDTTIAFGDDVITWAVADFKTDGNLWLSGSNQELRFYEGANYIGFEAPALTANQIWVLPTADGNADEVLSTDGSGNLAWAAAAGADEKVKIDAAATAGYLGAAFNDGVLRADGTVITYADGGDFVTIALDQSAVDHGTIGGLTDNDHTQYVLRQPAAITVINESGGDFDWRMEGNTDVNLFFLDAGADAIGIGTATPTLGKLEVVGNLAIGGSNNELRFYEGANYTGFEAPALAADTMYVLPAADGNADDVLTTDGSKNLAWAAGGSGTDVKAAIDSGATADYVGAAFNDGFLRTDGTILTYVDGGNYVTLTVADAAADDSTKGVATFEADDFDSASGKIDLADSVAKSFPTDSGTATPSGHAITLTGGVGIDTSGAAAAATITVDTTEINDVTWGDGGGSGGNSTWSITGSGGLDVLSFRGGQINITSSTDLYLTAGGISTRDNIVSVGGSVQATGGKISTGNSSGQPGFVEIYDGGSGAAAHILDLSVGSLAANQTIAFPAGTPVVGDGFKVKSFAAAKVTLEYGRIGSSVFGDADLGDVTLSSSGTLTEDRHYRNLTIDTNSAIDTNGFKIFVAETLTIDSGSSIHNNGNVGGNGAIGGPATTGGTAKPRSAYFPASGAGGAGGTPTALIGNQLGGSAGTADLTTPTLYAGHMLTGAGGGGGGGANPAPAPPVASDGSAGGVGTAHIGGVGGAGQSGNQPPDVGASGGAGGSGSGVCYVTANIIANAGTISANGGAGGNGVTEAAGNASGNGGGGGGGCAIVIYGSGTLGTVQAAAGAAGIGGNGGAAGAAGVIFTFTA